MNTAVIRTTVKDDQVNESINFKYLAHRCGMSIDGVKKALRTGNCSTGNMERLATAIGVKIMWLWYGGQTPDKQIESLFEGK